MELVRGKGKASGDIIGNIPDNVITNILDRLPIQDAVKTGILSRNWMYNWTMLSQLVFDADFFAYLRRTKAETSFYRKNLIRILLLLKGSITKFVLYIPKENLLDVEDMNYWIRFLSTRGIKELVLINMRRTPLKLPTHLSSCLELKHLKLHNCYFHLGPTFRGFPNLLSYDFQLVRLGSYKYGEFITLCPLLETLKFDHPGLNSKVKPIEIAKLQNLKKLSLSLHMLENVAVTRSGIFQLMGFLPKLQELDLDFQMCKFLAEAGAVRRAPAALRCLKTLTLCKLDFNNRFMVLCALDLIHGSPNLQTLKIKATHDDRVSPPPLSSWEVDCGIMGNLKLQIVELKYMKDSEIDLSLIKSLLAYASSLKKMVICHRTGGHANYTFAKKLLKFHRVSPVSEIDITPC